MLVYSDKSINPVAIDLNEIITIAASEEEDIFMIEFHQKNRDGAWLWRYHNKEDRDEAFSALLRDAKEIKDQTPNKAEKIVVGPGETIYEHIIANYGGDWQKAIRDCNCNEGALLDFIFNKWRVSNHNAHLLYRLGLDKQFMLNLQAEYDRQRKG